MAAQRLINVFRKRPLPPVFSFPWPISVASSTVMVVVAVALFLFILVLVLFVFLMGSTGARSPRSCGGGGYPGS